MIFERSQAVYFKDLKDGETFICPGYGGNRLFVKAYSLFKADANSFDLQLNQPRWFGDDFEITPIKVKIVQIPCQKKIAIFLENPLATAD